MSDEKKMRLTLGEDHEIFGVPIATIVFNDGRRNTLAEVGGNSRDEARKTAQRFSASSEMQEALTKLRDLVRAGFAGPIGIGGQKCFDMSVEAVLAEADFALINAKIQK